jgi:hypothetical protein
MNPPVGSGPTLVRETRVDAPPALVHPEWTRALPWLVQGTTIRGDAPHDFDLGMFSGGSAEAEVRARWDELAAAAGMPRAVHARQVHGRRVRTHEAGTPGLTLVDECDGHVSQAAGVLLAVATADCVPVFLLDPVRRVVGVLHAGWRGASVGVLEEGVAAAESVGARREDLRVHLGPAICERCYEVGPEVFTALGLSAPERPTPIDLRGALAARARSVGVEPEHVTVSAHCTRCTGSGLFSHRGGDAGRHVGYIGVRP